MSDGNKFMVAAVQATPVFLNREQTVEKACDLVAQASKQGARLALFPETFIPAYPCWVWKVASGEKKQLDALYSELLNNSVSIPSPAVERLCRAAKTNKIFIVVGINERNDDASRASLYNTLLYIDDHGNILGRHRKLVPTAGERLVWAQGDGSTLAVFDTPLGRVGGLICWENYMPLARYSMFAWGAQIYLAPTWDQGEPWISTLRHIAKEGRVYVIGCGMVIRRDDIPDRYEFKEKYDPVANEWINSGDSTIVNPDGKIIAGPISNKEEILLAEIESSYMRGPKWSLDVAGHFARPDVFQLTVNRDPYQMIGIKQSERNS